MRKMLFITALIVIFIMAAGPDAAIFTQAKGTDSNIVYDAGLFKGLKYRCVGPSRGGRVTTVAGIASQPSTFYMGSTGGGVWKTRDYGRNWVNVSDGFFKTGSIGAIRVAHTDPNVIYVGTGSDGIRSNVIKGCGMYKSTDAGKSWDYHLADGGPDWCG